MAYCTLAQLEDRYSQRLLISVSDRGDVAVNAVDTDLIDRAISDADALINGYLTTKYELPLTAVPQIVTDLSQRIAIYYAHSDTVSDKIKDDYNSALRQLVQISSGAIKLTEAAGAEASPSGASEIRTNEPDRPLTNDSMKGFI